MPGGRFLPAPHKRIPSRTICLVVALRVKVPQTSWGTFEYWGGSIYSSAQSLSGPFRTHGPLADSGVPGSDGWHVYVVDVPSLGVQAVAPGGVWGVASPAVKALHFDPTDVIGASVALDWVRIVNNDPGLYRTIGWAGSTSAVDIFLDSDTNYGKGTWGTIARSVTGSSLSFYVGALPPGDYYVAVRPSGSSAAPSYSPGFYRVASTPRLRFLSPSDEGSSDDFAPGTLHNATCRVPGTLPAAYDPFQER